MVCCFCEKQSGKSKFSGMNIERLQELQEMEKLVFEYIQRDDEFRKYFIKYFKNDIKINKKTENEIVCSFC